MGFLNKIIRKLEQSLSESDLHEIVAVCCHNVYPVSATATQSPTRGKEPNAASEVCKHKKLFSFCNAQEFVN